MRLAFAMMHATEITKYLNKLQISPTFIIFDFYVYLFLLYYFILVNSIGLFVKNFDFRFDTISCNFVIEITVLHLTEHES